MKKFSNISVTIREMTTTYEHNSSNWILGLPKTVITNGRDMATYAYDTLGRKTSETRYGAPYASYDYYGNSARLKWVDDAESRRTELHSYHRGSPQLIKRPDGNWVAQYYDDNGWLTSSRNARWYTTSYGRDSMGRLTSVTPPVQSATNISYSFPVAGGAEQTITRGSKTETITYDSMLRPVEVNVGNQVYTNTEYNGAGQKVFESFPSASAGSLIGTTYSYDGLGRLYDQVTSAGTTQHRYLDQHRKRIIDTSGKRTDYYAYGYGGPGNGDVAKIEQAISGNVLRTTEIFKNIWGETTQVKQSGNLNGFNVDKRHDYFYNNQRQICRYSTPEGGDAVYDYDLSGRLKSYEKGLPVGTACDTPSGTDKVTLTYNPLGQVTLTAFADGFTPDIVKTYDNNGNVKTVDRGGMDWSYAYSPNDQLLHEYLDVDGEDYDLSYVYDIEGRMTQRTLPEGRQINFTHDALGRQTSVQDGATNLASNISYHASGPVANLSYGNGYAFTQSLNALLQPDHAVSSNGSTTAFDRWYNYSQRGQITSITDSTDSAFNQGFLYDGLGQLKSATGQWGLALYKYDSLGNIRQKYFFDWHGSSRAVDIDYNTKNRVMRVKDTAGSGNWHYYGYDSRGNVSWDARGHQSFAYDMTDQPRAVWAGANGSYDYDGNLKRVKATVNNKTIYNIYDASGSLVHIHELNNAGASDDVRTDYVKGAGMSLARIKTIGSGADEVTYLHNDHLGSAAAMTTSTGSLLPIQRYTPFGEEWNTIAANDNLAGFTGHIKDKATGLNYMQARYYDPVVGRFLSVDPVTFNGSNNPAFFNRYSYTFNDPVNLVDVTGMAPDKTNSHTTFQLSPRAAATGDRINSANTAISFVRASTGVSNNVSITYKDTYASISNVIGVVHTDAKGETFNGAATPIDGVTQNDKTAVTIFRSAVEPTGENRAFREVGADGNAGIVFTNDQLTGTENAVRVLGHEVEGHVQGGLGTSQIDEAKADQAGERVLREFRDENK